MRVTGAEQADPNAFGKQRARHLRSMWQPIQRDGVWHV